MMGEWGSNINITLECDGGGGINIRFADRDYVGSDFGCSDISMHRSEALAVAAALQAFALNAQPEESMALEVSGSGWREETSD